MPTIHTKPFTAGNSQAIRLPKDFAYPDNTPLILSKNNGVITIQPMENLSSVPDIFAQIGKQIGEFERIDLDDKERSW
ncbi:antitoxin [Lonepinella sp. BR2271]|uniref:antitoxin n=1 Tax=Lonepinella sp. BR2271 TaxID=3434550 RepID=UPI003F6DDFA2